MELQLDGKSGATAAKQETYTADDIEVLEGLEPVRMRPGMYIGGSDENAMHHLVNEVFDNSMDEAVAGHASRIEINLQPNNVITISDNGRGIPIGKHPKFPDKSALEVILTTLHSGGKFSSKAYETSGGLHGVGISVVNALSDHLEVEVIRDKTLHTQKYSRGHAKTKIEKGGTIANRKGTSITFHPDEEIFGDAAKFRPEKLYRFARSKAYLFRGVEIRWTCDESLLQEGSKVPAKDTIQFPNGLADFLEEKIGKSPLATPNAFTGTAELADGMGRVEWAITWPDTDEGFGRSYCNTVSTPDGGTHESGMRAALSKGIKAYGEMVNTRNLAKITADDISGSAYMLLSVFIKDPQFQGQTKDKLVSAGATKLVENAIRDPFDHWLSDDAAQAGKLMEFIQMRMEHRMNRKKQKDTARKTITQRLRLPGKLSDCTRSNREGTEIFLVEGDSAGGSAKQARNRETQAILPLRGKILNVASATAEKIRANNEISDMLQALGVGTGKHYREDDLRYDKVIIMTDADVDGAHIAALLMTFFYQELPWLVRQGHLYLAQPPLFRVTHKGKTFYPADEAAKDAMVAELTAKGGKLDVGRFKGLGEMTAPQLKETTMLPQNRQLLQIEIAEDDEDATEERVNDLMGKKPELRFKFITEQTSLHGDKLKDALDV
ncbi:MAG: DNA topoisomerase IV subunit B [Rickettsiales bacterium]|nr:DNA topoisomerase IV subunit B [Rickettsiales bacterium]